MLEVETEENEKILVVEGFISTLPPPHSIILSNTAKYGSIFEGQIRREQGAEVWLRDELGNVTNLDDMGFGLYQTPQNFQAQVGGSYTLNIRTLTGERYASLPEKIESVPKLDSINLSYKKLLSVKEYAFDDGIEVNGYWQDPEGMPNYLIWRNIGIKGDRLEKNVDYSIYVHSDVFIDGSYNNRPVAFIQNEGDRFQTSYEVIIDQLSISKEAYQFFKLLYDQKNIDGDIFDAPPVTIRGNIINLDDPESPVIGYFYASDGHRVQKPVAFSLLRKF